MEKPFLDLFADAREAYNAYKDVKDVSHHEAALGEALGPLLHSVLELGRRLWMMSECEEERALMQAFSAELGRIFR